MKYKLTLSHGCSSRGAQMGRQDVLPKNVSISSCKLHLTRLKWVDIDYDEFGTYWGRSKPGEYIYCATGLNTLIFVRAKTRLEAKSLVKNKLMNVTFNVTFYN